MRGQQQRRPHCDGLVVDVYGIGIALMRTLPICRRARNKGDIIGHLFGVSVASNILAKRTRMYIWPTKQSKTGCFSERRAG